MFWYRWKDDESVFLTMLRSDEMADGEHQKLSANVEKFKSSSKQKMRLYGDTEEKESQRKNQVNKDSDRFWTCYVMFIYR